MNQLANVTAGKNFHSAGGSLWIVYAILSAIFAAFTSILAKIGIENVNSNLATAIRTVVVLLLAWGIVFIRGSKRGIKEISQRSMLFLILSGLATGLSWLFYYKAIQIGDVSKIVPIDKFSVVIAMVLAFLILKEELTAKTIIGGILITAGTFCFDFIRILYGFVFLLGKRTRNCKKWLTNKNRIAIIIVIIII